VSALTIIEVLGASLSNEEVWATIDHAGVLLEKTQNISTLRRLADAAFRALFLTQAVPTPPDWKGFSFWDAVHKHESRLISLALKETGGKVTAAARLLGFRHHQSLITLINSRHKDLLETRSAVRKRRRHLFSKSRKIKRKVVRQSPERGTSRISILHVEDNQQIAKLVDEMFAAEEWRVELCKDGYSALEKLTGNDHYDVLVVDNDLPGLNGLELIQRARRMAHRCEIPIVMLSATVDNAAARSAGADLGLRKPEEIGSIAEAIAGILRIESTTGGPESREIEQA
jgi:CheY-like chemotaxis protein